jgi:hypothetical protein
VPLPYYNPLEDPFLRGFFSNHKVRGHIEQQGLLYEPRQEYPYVNRRTKNAYRFHRDNSVGTPLSHQLRASEGSRSFMFSSQRDFREDDLRSSSPLSPLSPQLKRRAESEIMTGNKVPSLSEILSKRPSTQNQRKRMMASSDGKARSRIFQNKSFSFNRVEARKNPEND